MEAFMIYALLALVIVLFVVRGSRRRKDRELGERRWAAKQDRQASGDGLGATITLATDVATARGVVAPILEAGRRVRALPDGDWAQTHYNDDDVLYTLVSIHGGTVLHVSRAIEFAGTLNGARAWRKYRTAIAAAAAQRGIATVEGQWDLVRNGQGETGAQAWASTGAPTM